MRRLMQRNQHWFQEWAYLDKKKPAWNTCDSSVAKPT